jgi:hypothetical protein
MVPFCKIGGLLISHLQQLKACSRKAASSYSDVHCFHIQLKTKQHRLLAGRNGHGGSNSELNRHRRRLGAYQTLLDGASIPPREVSTTYQLALGVNTALHLEGTPDDKYRTQRNAGLVYHLMDLVQVIFACTKFHTNISQRAIIGQYLFFI